MNIRNVNSEKDSKSEDAEYTFIQETICRRKHTKLKKVAFTAGLAVIFGMVSSLTIRLLLPNLSEYFDDDPKVFPVGSDATATPEATVIPEETTSVLPTETDGNYMSDIIMQNNVFSNIKKMLKIEESKLVKITTITEQTDVLNNPIEHRKETCGIIVASKGDTIYVLTNMKNIDLTAGVIKAKFNKEETADAKIQGKYEELGICILSVEMRQLSTEVLSKISIADFGDSIALERGDTIIAIGAPNGSLDSILYGYITSCPYYTSIVDNQIDMFDTNLENNSYSQGFIITKTGKLIGMITQESGLKNSTNTQTSTCIGASKLKSVIQDLIENKDRIYLGVTAKAILPEMITSLGVANGVYVENVEVNSPAYEAGINSGDVIKKVGDKEISNMTNFISVLETISPGDTVEVTIVRMETAENKTFTRKITVGQAK